MMHDLELLEEKNSLIKKSLGVTVGDFSERGENIFLDQINLLFLQAYRLGMRHNKEMIDSVFEEHITGVSSNGIGGLDNL